MWTQSTYTCQTVLVLKISTISSKNKNMTFLKDRLLQNNKIMTRESSMCFFLLQLKTSLLLDLTVIFYLYKSFTAKTYQAICT